MMICDPCLDEHYRNFSVFRSYGLCEICEKAAPCADIPSRDLLPKGKDSKAQLLDYMLFLSEERFSAGWAANLASMLSNALINPTNGVLVGDQALTLRSLVSEAGGWWYLPKGADYIDPVFVTLVDWEALRVADGS